jgi:hypothetical protein
MPQRFTIFPDPPVAGQTATVTLSNAAGATFPVTATVTYFDSNGNEIGGNGLPLFTEAGQSHTINVPANCVNMQITSSQSATLARTPIK